LDLFLGTYEYAMDGRGRVPVPPRYRDLLTRGAVISQGSPDLCLRLYTVEGFERLGAIFMSQPVTRKAGRIARESYFGRAFPVDVDRQGRVLIPASLRAHAGLENSVIMIGAGEWLNIWSPEHFDEEMKLVDERLEDTLEAMEPGA
jgi:MraZ protein